MSSPLEGAIIRSGRAVPEVAYLAGLAESRVRAIIHGEQPTSEEREALQAVVGDWTGIRKPREPKGGR